MKSKKKSGQSILEDDPLWYKDAIIYEVHVRAFRDSNADGIGDLRGLVEKLDYLQDLGVTALWLLPFYPSPLRDDGYDIADYLDVNAIYGNLTDFKTLLREAHQRGLRVITELVINHTSDRHPWFQRARRAPPGSSYRDYYVWSDTPDKYPDARIIFSDYESSNWQWDPVAKAYYWHRFYAHQPDLNFDNPKVQAEVLSIFDFWLDMGIDGMRLDAIPYLYEREGTNCENLPETHAFLKKLRRHVDEHYRNRMLLAEANQWPEDAVAYYGAGDECHMAFHFPLMPRLFMAIRMEDRFPIIDILQQTPAIAETNQWALFLRNHDELTLEMVTADDRDYMVRMYAQDPHARVNLGIRRRLAPLLENHRGKMELINALLFSLPGTPVVYYGDEIGMGDNIYLGDRHGVRTPMQWTQERNAGFSEANPQKLYLPIVIDPEYHNQSVNVESQQNNPHSLLWWMKRMIALRKRYQAFGRGTLEFLLPENHKVLVYLRCYKEEQILVVANLSRFVQYVELNLDAFKGKAPVEMMGRTSLPPITERPYLLTLSPYSYYWLMLEPVANSRLAQTPAEISLPTLHVADTWQDVFRDRAKEKLEGSLLPYLSRQRWFSAKGGQPSLARIIEQVPITREASTAYLALVQVEYADGEARTFVLPIAFLEVPTGAAPTEGDGAPPAAICKLHVNENLSGYLYDPMQEKGFAQALLDAIARHRRSNGADGELSGRTTSAFHRRRCLAEPRPEAMPVMERSNSLVQFGDKSVLKLFRCVEEGINPEVELGRVLAEKTTFTHAPPVAGTLEYRSTRGQMTLAALMDFVPHQGDAWQYTQDALRRYFEQILTLNVHDQKAQLADPTTVEVGAEKLPPQVPERIGSYLETARILGRSTAELHVALGSIADDPEFAPEPFTINYQRSSYQAMRTSVFRVFDLLRSGLPDIPKEEQAEAQILLARTSDLIQHFRAIINRKISAQRIRCHGDYRLSNLLYTGKDFVVVDFEGDVLRRLSNRRHKRTPLRDVAGLICSLDLAVRSALQQDHLRPEDRLVLEPWSRYWHRWVSAIFLQAYRETAATASFLPRIHEEIQILLDYCLLSCGIFEIRRQILNDPRQIKIPLQALLHLLDGQDQKRPG